MRYGAVLLASVGVLVACSPMPLQGPVPLSRLTIDNRLESAEYLRATWSDGLEQVAEIPVGPPLYFSGSIGGGFPGTLEVLDADCELIDSVTGVPWDTYAMLIVDDGDVTVEPISRGNTSWAVAQTTEECRTKPPPP